MGAGRADKKRFADVLASGWSLLPTIGGASLLIVAWGLDWDVPAFLYAGGAGLAAGLVAIVIQAAAASAVDPATKELRRQFLQTLATVGQERTKSQKAERITGAAPAES